MFQRREIGWRYLQGSRQVLQRHGALRAQFPDAAGYLAACTVGLPTSGSRAAIAADLAGRPDVAEYSRAVEASRAHFARLVGVTPDRVAIGAQTSVQVALLAASVPEGADVLVPEHEFSSLVLPFVHAGRGIRVRTAPVPSLSAQLATPRGTVCLNVPLPT